MRTPAGRIITGFICGLVTSAAIVAALWLGAHQKHEPVVGDVYAEFTDNRTGQYALTNGFLPEVVGIFQVTAITNGIACCKIHEVILDTNDIGKTMWQLGYPSEEGPVKNLTKYSNYRHFIPADPK